MKLRDFGFRNQINVKIENNIHSSANNYMHLWKGVSKTRGRDRGPGRGRALSFFKDRVSVNPTPNPNTKTTFFKKKVNPDPGPNPAFYWHPLWKLY